MAPVLCATFGLRGRADSLIERGLRWADRTSPKMKTLVLETAELVRTLDRDTPKN